jgi:predicted RecB family nuclease
MNSHQESNLPPGLSKPAQRALTNAGYRQLEQLARLNEAEVERLHGVGPKALAQLRHALVANGLSFADGRGADQAGTHQ